MRPGAHPERRLTPDEAQIFRREMAARGLEDLGGLLSFTWDGPGKQRRGRTERPRAKRIAAGRVGFAQPMHWILPPSWEHP
jgi:hypothetical protein